MYYNNTFSPQKVDLLGTPIGNKKGFSPIRLFEELLDIVKRIFFRIPEVSIWLYSSYRDFPMYHEEASL